MRRQSVAVGLGFLVLAALGIGYKTCSRPSPSSPDALKSSDKKAVDVANALRSKAVSSASTAQAASELPGSRPLSLPHGGVVFSSPWGGQSIDQVGRNRPEEGNPEGPMSLSVDAKGRVYVLDQVNARVVKHSADGKAESAFPIGSEASQDIAIASDGKVAVLDRFSSKSVSMYDDSGALIGDLPLVGGPGKNGEGEIDKPGLVTGVFVDGQDVYAEREHGPLVRIGDTSGKPAEERTEIPGRPTRDGLSYINAGIIDAQLGRAYVSSIVRASMEHRFTREVRMDAMIRTILLLDSDKSGMIYFGTQVERAPNDQVVFLICLEPEKGTPVGTVILPVNSMPEESFRDLVVLDQGGVVYAIRSEAGVSYQHYSCDD